MSFGFIKHYNDIEIKEMEINAETARMQVKTAIEKQIKNGLLKINKEIQEASCNGMYLTLTNVFDDVRKEACEEIVQNLVNRGFEVDEEIGRVSWMKKEE